MNSFSYWCLICFYSSFRIKGEVFKVTPTMIIWSNFCLISKLGVSKDLRRSSTRSSSKYEVFLQMVASLSRMIFLTLSSLVLAKILTYEYNEALIVETLLLIEVDVIAHSRLTDYEDFMVKSRISLRSLAFWLESYLHLILKTLRMANLRISPTSYKVWLLTWNWMYCMAFCGLVL